MSRECLRNCPNIQASLDSASSANTNSALLHVPAGGDSLNNLMAWCEASYDCAGPELTEVEVIKGVFKKHTETETQYACQYPAENQA